VYFYAFKQNSKDLIDLLEKPRCACIYLLKANATQRNRIDPVATNKLCPGLHIAHNAT